jgi:Holliday junction DNA helicase RuvA
MIASLEGIVGLVHADHVVIIVGGVGFRVSVPTNTITSAVGDLLFLHTLMLVREDAITLYGFRSEAEREAFERLISVSGVGPRIALSVLGAISLDRLYSAVASGSVEAFTRIPGVGKKTAEKILFELKDKLKGADGLIPAAGTGGDVNRDVLEALLSFGYSASEAQAALRAIPADTPDDFEERMRRALQHFI